MLPQDFLGRVLFLLHEYGFSLLKGATVTMVIAIVCTFFGCIIGFAVGIVQTIPLNRRQRPLHWFLIRVLQLILGAYVEIFRGTPMMVQAMFIYYGAAALFGINMSMWGAALFIVSINTGAYMAESVRGGILSIDAGQTEGAKGKQIIHNKLHRIKHVRVNQKLQYPIRSTCQNTCTSSKKVTRDADCQPGKQGNRPPCGERKDLDIR